MTWRGFWVARPHPFAPQWSLSSPGRGQDQKPLCLTVPLQWVTRLEV